MATGDPLLVGDEAYVYVVGSSAYPTITDALTAANSTGGTIFLPAGTYTVSATLTVSHNNVVFKGEGKGSIISRNFSSGHTISISNYTDCGFENLAIYDTGLSMPANAAHIYLYKANTAYVRNVYIRDCYYGVYIAAGEDIVIDGVIIQAWSKAIQAGFYVTDVSSDSPFIQMVNCSVIGGGSYRTVYGMHIIAADAIHVSNCYFGDCSTYDINIVMTTGKALYGVSFNNCFFDAPNSGTLSASVNISGTGSVGSMLLFEGCMFHGASVGTGLYVDTGCTVTHVLVQGCDFYRYEYCAIQLNGGSQIDIRNNKVSECSLDSTGTHAGIYVNGVSYFNITNNSSGYSLFSTTATQGYGILVGGTCDYYTIIGNNCYGNSTGVSDGGSGAHKIVEHNAS